MAVNINYINLPIVSAAKSNTEKNSNIKTQPSFEGWKKVQPPNYKQKPVLSFLSAHKTGIGLSLLAAGFLFLYKALNSQNSITDIITGATLFKGAYASIQKNRRLKIIEELLGKHR